MKKIVLLSSVVGLLLSDCSANPIKVGSIKKKVEKIKKQEVFKIKQKNKLKEAERIKKEFHENEKEIVLLHMETYSPTLKEIERSKLISTTKKIININYEETAKMNGTINDDLYVWSDYENEFFYGGGGLDTIEVYNDSTEYYFIEYKKVGLLKSNKTGNVIVFDKHVEKIKFKDKQITRADLKKLLPMFRRY